MEIRDFQRLMKELYIRRDLKRGVEKTYVWLVQEVGELGRAILKGDRENLMEEIADVFAWLASLSNILGIDMEYAVVAKYDGKCPKCGKNPCECED
ncbi:MAG: MazG nucleotide pyrophosphohydrolase domain-containing protein [Candidatus Asgardarchaeia archaeon]